MNRFYRFVTIIVTLALVPLAFGASASIYGSPKTPVLPVKFDEEMNAVPSGLLPTISATDEVDSIRVQIGTTYADFFSYGANNRSIQRDYLGGLHACWMNPRASGGGDRVVSYNFREPTGGWFSTTGSPAFSGTGAGYTNLDTRDDGYAVIAAHRPGTSQGYSTVFGVDIGYQVAAFMEVVPPRPTNPLVDSILWPIMTVGHNNVIQNFSRARDGSATWSYSRIFYTNSDTASSTASQFRYAFPTYAIAYPSAASRVSDKVTVAWPQTCIPNGYNDLGGWAGYLASQINNDVVIKTSYDNGATFDFTTPTNVTRFRTWDATYFANHPNDTLLAAGDTFRSFNDMAMVYDMQDRLHIIFTVQLLAEDYTEDTTAGPPVRMMSNSANLMYHWTEADPDTFHAVADGMWGLANRQSWRSVIDRPSLSVGTNGNLYATFTRYDYGDVSSNGWPCGDIYVTMSTDNGTSWYYPTNITNTPGDSLPSGQAHNEIWATAQEVVDNDTLYVMYVDDRSGGSATFESALNTDYTLNQVYVQSVPVNSISRDSMFVLGSMLAIGDPVGPLWVSHMEHTRYSSVEDPANSTLPIDFTLSAYPNPFNPVAKINFNLPVAAKVSMKVYDVNGREVTTLVNGKHNAGANTVEWRPTSISSGVYFVKMSAGATTKTEKIVFMK